MLLDRDRDWGGIEGPVAGGGAGPSTLRRFSSDSGLEERFSSSSRGRFARCGGKEGPIGIVVRCCAEVSCRGEMFRAWGV